MTTDDVWLLIACIWEWLSKGVFGRSETLNEPQDLWIEERNASRFRALEDVVCKLQSKCLIFEVIEANARLEQSVWQEWSAFSVQCLHEESSDGDVRRITLLIDDIFSWLLPMIGRSEFKEKEIERLRQKFKQEVVLPAVSFSALLGKRFVPLELFTPSTVENVVRRWMWQYSELEGLDTALEIITSPELRKLTSPATAASKERYETLFSCCRHFVTRATRHNGMQPTSAAQITQWTPATTTRQDCLTKEGRPCAAL